MSGPPLPGIFGCYGVGQPLRSGEGFQDFWTWHFSATDEFESVARYIRVFRLPVEELPRFQRKLELWQNLAALPFFEQPDQSQLCADGLCSVVHRFYEDCAKPVLSEEVNKWLSLVREPILTRGLMNGLVLTPTGPAFQFTYTCERDKPVKSRSLWRFWQKE